ncbi:unnamed protein product [Prunus armeniaca]
MRLAKYIETMSGLKVCLIDYTEIYQFQLQNYLIPSKGSYHYPPALCIPSSSSCHAYSRAALLFKYIQDEHEACTRKGRNLLSQSLLRPPGSAPEKDPTRLAA